MINLGLSQPALNVTSFLFKKFNVVSSPYIFIGSDTIKNFDTYLFFDADEVEFSVKRIDLHLTDVNYIGGPRYTKTHQYLIMKKLGIKHPKFISPLYGYNDDERQDEIHALLPNLSGSDILIKSNNGARGIGQALIPRTSLHNIIKDAHRMGSYEFNEKWKLYLGGSDATESDSEYFTSCLQNRDYLISEKLEHKHEFRAIYLSSRPDNPIIVKRNITDTWQANTSVTGYGEQIEFSDLDIPGFNKDKFLRELRKLAQLHNYPWLSTDVYVMENGEHGFFEFQMQFGYESIDKDTLIKEISDSVETTLKEINES